MAIFFSLVSFLCLLVFCSAFRLQKYDAEECYIGQTTTTEKACVFPFTYKGVEYRSCTTKDSERPWCYETDTWGNCAGFARSGVKTVEGESCAFPFIYKGVVYMSCTTKNHDRPWCSTTVDYDKDKKWGNCAGFQQSGSRTTSGEHCAFPFIYGGKKYNSCFNKRHDRLWCSTTTNYDKDNKWGNCA